MSDIGIPNTLAEYADHCQLRYFAHKDCFKFYERWSNFLNFPSLVLSALLTIGNIIIAFVPNQYSGNIALASIGFAFFVYTGICKMLDFDAKKGGHQSAYIAFDGLNDDIQNHMKTNIHTKETSLQFFTLITSQFKRLKESSPFVPTSFYKLAIEKYKMDNNVQIPYYMTKKIKHIPDGEINQYVINIQKNEHEPIEQNTREI
ncbi:hypothetical protein BMW23_0968 [Bodo saltans virus]|uniref:Uncharacterized protein n=1 Tax=Bodo saltans virus TaxID=2024608 RepID=A0A2H4UVR7_9VIRU|nr:hypothetical protein QJ851_gp0950 [Bodo saltans virus]ATZ81013.1 hypothetical protein BMW23_0968 [Bodo saltans virus]